ncbi:MAG: hypothetical protein WD757_03820 [Actinomycetota bacterium]
MGGARIAVARALRLLVVVPVIGLYVAGVIAYFNNFNGVFKLAGLIPGSVLLLPLIGRGEIAGVPVHSYYWWFWALVVLSLYYLSVWLHPEILVRDSAAQGQAPPRWAWKRLEHLAKTEWGKGICYSCGAELGQGAALCDQCGAPAPGAGPD